MVRTPLTLATLGLVFAAHTALAQTGTPEIQKILDDSAGAYRNITSFSTTLETAQNSSTVSTRLTVTRDGKLAAVITTGHDTRHVVADGKSIYSDNSADAKRYFKQAGTKLDDAVSVLALNGGAGVGLLPILLTSPSAEKQIIPGKPSSLTKEAEQKLDGVSCNVIAAIVVDGPRKMKYQFAFGKDDHFLRRVTVGPEAGTPTVTESYKDVTTRVSLTPALFLYKPAPGAVATDAPKEPAYFDPALKVGAEPFGLSGSDLAGKTVSLAEYKGKVLMLDFWATWCGPCVAELPNVLNAYKKYHDKGFEVVGISLDQANDKPKLESFIHEKGMAWRQIYDGKFWESANAVKYGVRAIPFTLLIGRAGKIVAVGARGEALAPAIEAALNQK
jgi:thiol-disulfide isomerase/thioredoxin/outer membrane lipoprotein-sorting protein